MEDLQEEMGQTVVKTMKELEASRKGAASWMHETMGDFKSNDQVAEDKLLAIVDEVKSSSRNVGSHRSSRFDKYVPRDSGGSRA
eukprot:1416425-Karenia_brevis.AAC.1